MYLRDSANASRKSRPVYLLGTYMGTTYRTLIAASDTPDLGQFPSRCGRSGGREEVGRLAGVFYRGRYYPYISRELRDSDGDVGARHFEP